METNLKSVGNEISTILSESQGKSNRQIVKPRIRRNALATNSDKNRFQLTIGNGYNIVKELRHQAGLNYHYKKIKHRTLIYVFLLLLIGLACWRCSNSILRFFDWKVKTQIAYKISDDIQYPTITLCSRNLLRKSVVGSQLLVHIIMAAAFVQNEKDLFQLATKSAETCKRENETVTFDLQELINTAMELKKASDLNKFVQHMAMDSFLHVKKCWWNNVEFECNGTFSNTFFDAKLCFTFNTNQYLSSLAQVGDTVTYGLDSTPRQWNIINTGRNRGLRLLIDAYQEEYCGVYSKYSGVGFDVFIHDYERPQSSQSQAGLSLSPGYHTNVLIKQSLFDRRTEFLGLCKSKMNFFLWPNKFDRYIDELCYTQCALDLIWKRCKCLMTKVEYTVNIAAKHYGVRNITICSTSDLRCAKTLAADVVSVNFAKLCGCPAACYENTYEYTVSTSIFPSKSISHLFHDYNFSNYKRASKNAALVDFTFESKSVQVVVECQSFTITDLFTYIGGSFGLFLGWSVTILAGLILHVVYYVNSVCIWFVKRKIILPLRKLAQKKSQQTSRSVHPIS